MNHSEVQLTKNINDKFQWKDEAKQSIEEKKHE